MRSLDDLQVAPEMRQDIGCVLTHHEYILGARAELAWHEYARLNGEAHPFLKQAAVAFVEKGWLVHVQTDSMSKAVSEILAVTSVGDHLPRSRVDFFRSALA